MITVSRDLSVSTLYAPIQIHHLPSDLIEKICSYLDHFALQNIPGVCSQWFNITSDPSFWQSVLSLRYKTSHTEQMSQCVQTHQISWRKMAANISLFLFLQEESFKNDSLPEGSEAKPHSFCQNTYYQCFISVDAQSIHLISKTTQEHSLLKSEENLKFTRVAIDEDFVYALQENGKIIQWDYFNQKTQLIGSQYEQVITQFQHNSELCYTCCHFYSLQGHLILIYNSEGFCTTKTQIQIFSNLQTITDIYSHFIEIEEQATAITVSRVFHINEHTIYLSRHGKISIYHQIDDKIETIPLHLFWHNDPTISKNFIFQQTRNNQIKVYDLISQQWVGKLSLPFTKAVQLSLPNPHDGIKIFFEANFIIGLSDSQLYIWESKGFTLVATLNYEEQNPFSILYPALEALKCRPLTLSEATPEKKVTTASRRKPCIIS